MEARAVTLLLPLKGFSTMTSNKDNLGKQIYTEMAYKMIFMATQLKMVISKNFPTFC